MCICVCVCACTRLPNITLSARIDKCTKKSCLCMFVCASVVGACRRVSVHMGYACCVFVCMCQNAMCKPVCLMKGVSLGCSMGVTGPILMCMLFFKPVVWMCWNSVTWVIWLCLAALHWWGPTAWNIHLAEMGMMIKFKIHTCREGKKGRAANGPCGLCWQCMMQWVAVSTTHSRYVLFFAKEDWSIMVENQQDFHPPSSRCRWNVYFIPQGSLAEINPARQASSTRSRCVFYYNIFVKYIQCVRVQLYVLRVRGW